VKFARPCKALHKELFGKIRQGNSLHFGTDDTTQLPCSLKPHESFKRKSAAFALCSSTYVVFVHLQLSWQLTSFTHRRHLARFATF